MQNNHDQFTIEDVTQLGQTLIQVADQFPTTFLTERDFFPLVLAYLQGRVPGVTPEHEVEAGKIDFRIGGPNPCVLELVVAPRLLADRYAEEVRFPGHEKGNQLYASQNKTELRKLGAQPQTRAKMRYLLLVDFGNYFNENNLKPKYQATASDLALDFPVRVVYVSRSKTFHFPVK